MIIFKSLLFIFFLFISLSAFFRIGKEGYVYGLDEQVGVYFLLFAVIVICI